VTWYAISFVDDVYPFILPAFLPRKAARAFSFVYLVFFHCTYLQFHDSLLAEMVDFPSKTGGVGFF